MPNIKIKDKEFAPFISGQTIFEAIDRIAVQINSDLKESNPLFLCVLNGAFMFASDLMKRVSMPAEISFVKLASYSGTASTGNVKQLIGLSENIEGRTVVVVEDIVDTGHSMQALLETLKSYRPKEVRMATLLLKPDALQVPLDLHYVALRIPKDFIVGYGLDYDGYGRNLPAIYKIVE